MKPMKLKAVHDFLFKNISYKILSLAIAAVLWFVGMNIHDPAVTGSFNVQVTLLNEDRITANNLYLLNEVDLENTSINFVIRGRSSQITELRRLEKEIKAVIDLSPIDISNAKDIGTPLSATVNLVLPDSLAEGNFERVNTYPSSVDIKLDYLVSTHIPVSLIPVGGGAAEGYVAFTHLAELIPSVVRITGPKSIVDSVHTAEVKINLNGATEEIKTAAELLLYDKNSREIVSLQKNFDEVEVRIPIMKYAKIPINLPITVGTVSEGYRITKVSLNIGYVEVTGTEDEIAALPRINLEPAIVSDISKTTQYPYDLRAYLQGTKLNIREGTAQEVIVTVAVEIEETTEFILKNIRTIGELEDGLAVRTKNELSVSVKGLATDVAAIDYDAVTGYIDVAGLSAGTYELPVMIHGLPSAIRETEEHFIEVIIEDIGEESYDG